MFLAVSTTITHSPVQHEHLGLGFRNKVTHLALILCFLCCCSSGVSLLGLGLLLSLDILGLFTNSAHTQAIYRKTQPFKPSALCKVCHTETKRHTLTHTHLHTHKQKHSIIQTTLSANLPIYYFMLTITQVCSVWGQFGVSLVKSSGSQTSTHFNKPYIGRSRANNGSSNLMLFFRIFRSKFGQICRKEPSDALMFCVLINYYMLCKF